MSKKKIYFLVSLAVFAILQMTVCFIAAMNTTGLLSIFCFCVGGVSCLFGVALDFLLLIIAVDVFGSVFSLLATSLARKGEEEDEEVEIMETPEDDVQE